MKNGHNLIGVFWCDFFPQYPYANPPDNIKLQSLVRIVLNTLDAQQHVCRRIPATLMVGAPPSRSRGKPFDNGLVTMCVFLKSLHIMFSAVLDVSQPSLGADGERSSDKDRMETPPLSPMYTGVDPIGLIHSSGKTGKHQALFHQKSPGVGPGASLETHLEEDDSAAGGSQDTKRFGRRPLGSRYELMVARWIWGRCGKCIMKKYSFKLLIHLQFQLFY